MKRLIVKELSKKSEGPRDAEAFERAACEPTVYVGAEFEVTPQSDEETRSPRPFIVKAGFVINTNIKRVLPSFLDLRACAKSVSLLYHAQFRIVKQRKRGFGAALERPSQHTRKGPARPGANL
jgi:hypothetical protein